MKTDRLIFRLNVPCLEEIADRGEVYRRRALYFDLAQCMYAWSNTVDTDAAQGRISAGLHERAEAMFHSAMAAAMIMGPSQYDGLNRMFIECVKAYRRSVWQ